MSIRKVGAVVALVGVCWLGVQRLIAQREFKAVRRDLIAVKPLLRYLNSTAFSELDLDWWRENDLFGLSEESGLDTASIKQQWRILRSLHIPDHHFGPDVEDQFKLGSGSWAHYAHLCKRYGVPAESIH